MLEVYLERLNDVWDTPPEQHGVDVLPAGALRGAIELDGVSFTYRRDSPWVLRDISLTILHGSRIAIVGHTGSGKSSLARLIAGLYEPTSGRILLDGVDLSGMERGSVRRQFGIVTQDAQLFGGSIRRNIAFGDPDVGLDRVIRAAKLACLHDEIMSMPLKYETLLADRGLSLSGGQRQRLSIARALARNPKILVLDEATSHLDAVMEGMVNRSLATLRCTTIVIAHRLTTVQDADLIVVLDKGRIVELGRHDELMRQRARYAELARA
jgi:ATP-binding cassette subfamily B protein